MHAGSIALVLNPTTGHVSPQFHVVFDDTFGTVPYMDKKQVPPNWTSLVEASRKRVTEEQYNLAENWLTNSVQSPNPLPDNTTVLRGSQSDQIRGLKTDPSIDSDMLSSPVDANRSPNIGRRASKQDSNSPARIPSAHLVDQTPQYVPEDLASAEDDKKQRHVSFDLENPSTIDAHTTTSNKRQKKTSHKYPLALLNPSPTATPMLPACKGELSNAAPSMINLETSGLRRSERIRKKDTNSTNSGPLVMAYYT